MKLRHKLERLAPPKANAPPSDVAAVPARSSPVRERLERRTSKRAEQNARGFRLLDLEPIAQGDERVLVRRRVFGVDHRVGDVSLEGAFRPALGTLALLANDPNVASLAWPRALFLDTETTGLSGGTGTVAFLIGVGFFEGDSFVVEQFVLEDFGRERPMLARLSALVSAASAIVTFNGKSFDWPLLRTRFAMAKLAVPEVPPHLDLLHVARRVHRASDRECSLVALERDVLAFHRVGDISSAEVAGEYARALRAGRIEQLLGAIDHNVQDVVTMAALVARYGRSLNVAPETGAGVSWDATELCGIAETALRSRHVETARSTAAYAAQLGETRAWLVHARASRTAQAYDDAMRSYERALVVDPRADARLELAKLYEHRAKRYDDALALTEEGVGEDAAGARKRSERLRTKRHRAEQIALFPDSVLLTGSTKAR